MTVRPVLLESPYAGDVRTNVRYAEACLFDSLARGEAPMAGHLLYTRVLDDGVPEQRQRGLGAHLAWVACVEAVVVYIDRGISSGMRQAIECAWDESTPVEYRKLGARWETAPQSENVLEHEGRRLLAT